MMCALSPGLPIRLPRPIAAGAALLACLMVSVANPMGAQEREVVAEFGASHFLQPTGVPGEAAQFLVGGLRGAWTTRAGTGFQASFLGGWAASEATGGDFASVEAGGAAWLGMGRRWALGIRGRGLGFLVRAPVPYRSAALELGPTLAFLHEDISLTLEGVAGLGRSRAEFETAVSDDGGGGGHGGGPGGGMGGGSTNDSTVLTVVHEDLWRAGGRLQLLGRVGPLMAGATGGIHETSGGLFRSMGLHLTGSGKTFTVGGRLESWWMPQGRETVAGITLSLPLGEGWSLRGFLGKTEPDPLTLATSSGNGGGMLVGRRLLGGEEPDGLPGSHRTVRRTPSGATVRFTLSTPKDAEAVTVMGDFTLWEPRAMTREGGLWVLEMEIPEGLYHYGFLVDEDWFIPEEARDVVPDEWGRESVTLLVEGDEG